MSTVKKEKEVWASPPSLNIPYLEVSNLGRVRVLEHDVVYLRKGKPQIVRRQARLLRCTFDTRGRYFLPGRNSYPKTSLVHRLVAECFVPNPNPEQYKFVFFKNGDVSDCRASNLAWGSKAHYDRRGVFASTHKIYTLRNKGLVVKEFWGCAELAKWLGITKQAVHVAMQQHKQIMGYDLEIREPTDKERKRMKSICNVQKAMSQEPSAEILYAEEEDMWKAKAVFS